MDVLLQRQVVAMQPRDLRRPWTRNGGSSRYRGTDVSTGLRFGVGTRQKLIPDGTNFFAAATTVIVVPESLAQQYVARL